MAEDLKIKIGSKLEKFWTDAKEKAEGAVFESKRVIEINEQIAIYAEKRIKEEQNLNKSEK